MFLSRERFNKLEEFVGYLFGLSFFVNFKFSKDLVTVMVVLMVLRYVLFKEKLNCGDEKIKKFLYFFLFGGLIWNYFAGMSFVPVRQYLKIMRWVILPFYFYPVMLRDKKYIYKFMVPFLFGGVLSFFKSGYEFMKSPWTRVQGFDGVPSTGFGGMVLGNIGIGILLCKEKIKEKILGLIILGLGLGLIVFTQMRGALIGLIIGSIIIGVFEINWKKLLIGLGIILVILGVTFKNIEHSRLQRFTTTFDMEKNSGNSSNYTRILLWENGIWRIKKHPIMGSGTNNDKKLFLEYAQTLPENTPFEKYMKYNLIDNEFSDTHNMYINAISDNGIFSLVQFFIWFIFSPYLLLKNLKINDKNLKMINLICGGVLSAYYFSGLTWSVWRNKWTPMIFWICFTGIVYIYGKLKEELNGNN
ncbi:O-antigen ligase [Cetobacterium ceti]|uniref:O-antigen ligase n=1 Tax=Cetobacterium ceti TaxID=180163 RepID=A0A1T4LRU1_9FUSO|nr:O-antigen ligase family protein [Cetobacterium ceti]SJZ57440.1 O-antigen ligase [Cetobacterium ceti]